MRPEGNDSSVSPTPLPLILVRTQRGRNSREGFAQIGVNARSPQTYSAGALLANGARLTEIYDHYVVLERDGRIAHLYLQGEAQPDARSARALLTVGGTPGVASVVTNSRNELTDYLRPSPVFVGGELHGYALYPGRKATPFAQLGLQSGDVLTRINSTAVSNSPDSLAALQTLIDGEALTVEVERQGVTQPLSLDGSVFKRAVSTERQATPIDMATAQKVTLSVALPSLLTQGNRP
jgi:general secretion pathway protein C